MQRAEVSEEGRYLRPPIVAPGADPVAVPAASDANAGSWQNLKASSDDQHINTRKRRRDQLSPEAVNAASTWLNDAFPDLEPSATSLPERIWALEIPNPFLVNAVMRHPRIREHRATVQIPLDGCINGLIKIRLNTSKKTLREQPMARLQRFPWAKSRVELSGGSDSRVENPIAHLPPDFGKAKLSPQDEKLFEFLTLIPDENCYLKEVLPIAARNDCVKHAILALAATYIMDYATDEKIETRANFHWKRAVHLLTKELDNVETCQPGKEDAVLAAMAIFSHNEVVNWELEQPREEHPTWYHATHLAEQVLSKSDPLYRYYFPSNVQCSRARIQLGNKIALYNIMSATAWPLEMDEDRCPFTWLLEGSEEERRKIVGRTGCSPRLMHTFAQIAHLSAKLLKDPQRIAAQKLGGVLASRLDNFWQWSDLSQGYATSQDLVNSSVLDENGKVFSAAKVTELIAETYAAAAQIFLLCRLLRKQRKHPLVQKTLRHLLWCIDVMPTSGALFTAQSAQLRVFIAAVVACEVEHRELIRKWFEELVDGTRRNVPPVWRAVQFLWGWLDCRYPDIEKDTTDDSNEVELDAEAEPWWEALVGELFAREGKLNLA